MPVGGTGWEAAVSLCSPVQKNTPSTQLPHKPIQLFCHHSSRISICHNSKLLFEACEQSIPTVNFKCRLVERPGRPGTGSRGRSAGEQGTCQDALLLVTSCLSLPHRKQAWLIAQRMPHPCLVLSVLPTGHCHTHKSQRMGIHHPQKGVLPKPHTALSEALVVRDRPLLGAQRLMDRQRDVI